MEAELFEYFSSAQLFENFFLELNLKSKFFTFELSYRKVSALPAIGNYVISGD
jgi:hypothetical protein